jgi:hypothetical protein
MRRLLVVLMLSSGFLLAQSSNPGANDQSMSKDSNSQVTMQGCVDRERGDYVLIQQSPAATWELQGTGKIKINKYFGQRVEVTGTKVTSLPTSSDSMTGSSSPSPVTIMVSSVKVLDKSCASHQVSH